MTGPAAARIDRIEGRALPLRGDDIDTDRIIPARFLRAITFDGLEAHVFEDDRRAAHGALHPFDRPAFQGASILLVERNFGCGSSREHAPQALVRRGIRACVGRSFSEIFLGNAAALGLPCLSVAAADLERLMVFAESNPGEPMVVSVSRQTVSAGPLTLHASMSPGAREAFLDGLWDATALLMDRVDEVQAVARHLPYLRGWS